MTMEKKYYGNIRSFKDLQKERDKLKLSLNYVEDKIGTDLAYIKKEASFKNIAGAIFKNVLPLGSIISSFKGNKTYNSKGKGKSWIQALPFLAGTILPAVFMRMRKRK